MLRLMDTTGVSVDSTNSDDHVSNNNQNASNSSSPTSRRSSSPRTTSFSSPSSPPFPIIRFLQAPVTTLIEYSGVFSRPRLNNEYNESESLISNNRIRDHTSSGSGSGSVTDSNRSSSSSSDGNGNGNGDGNSEVSIRIMSGGDHEEERGEAEAVDRGDGGGEREVSGSGDVSGVNGNDSNGNGHGNVDSAYQQRYDLQQVSRWIEQILPFSLLLLVVFVRQHLQGIFVTLYITAFMYKSNDILRKQTALKGERKLSVLVGYCIVFMVHVIGVYWWYQNDDLCNPLFMVPPKAIPPFWNAIFTIIVNDTMVRQAAMAFKLVLLMYYKNGRGHSFRRQGQMLTLVEYTLLLYRAFLPAPVWYRFFLNKEYGSLFSSLTTGLYLTLKLTSVVEKIGSFYAALKALSRKEVNYGSHATAEQVSEAGDLCAICQEKMQAPILLRCKHIFCEDCVSEWFERERTCPLCRALVRPADIRTFGDGSTSLFFQVF
ncbi:putative transcription factor C2H2 family [Helianthus annuus]|nr:putative transcription factor C2H2 family [Helianthus annuus]